MINKNFTINKFKFLNLISRTDGLFGICKSELIKNQNYINDNRCDMDRYGAVAIDRTDNINYIINTPKVLPLKDVSNVTDYFNFYHEPGKFTLLFLKIDDEEVMNHLFNRDVATGAKTFGGLLKLMMEWRVMRNAPFNSQEDPAILSEMALNSLAIPEIILSEIWKSQPDMQVLKFLKGDNSARSMESNPVSLPYDFYKWVEDVFYPDDYIEIDGKQVSVDDPRIGYIEINKYTPDSFYNNLI